MGYEGKKILIVGFERTGEAVCGFMLSRGAEVRVSEKRPPSGMEDKIAAWERKGARFETGGHSREWFMSADMIIPSPGVPPLPLIREAAAKGIPVVSELELASRHLKGRIIGITGSNGKSTTTTLTWRILKDAGLRAFLAGNIGTPLISFVDKSRDEDVYATEISSFQLDYVDDFKPAAGAFLNISPNHIDWHGSYEKYFEAKKKLFRRLGPRDFAVLNRDDRLAWSLAADCEAQVFSFSRKRKPRRGAYIEDGRIVLRLDKPEALMPVSAVGLPGAHNLENVMAAALLGRLFGVPASSIRKTVRTFSGLEHRLEKAGTIGRVLFVNDSKATTVEATIKALESFDRPIVLILGGRGKGAPFTPLRRHMKDKVRAAVVLGEAGDEIESALAGTVPLRRASGYREAVRLAHGLARPGDVVLLAPACTSWDMFKDFEERGRVFKREVRLLAAAGKRGKAC